MIHLIVVHCSHWGVTSGLACGARTNSTSLPSLGLVKAIIIIIIINMLTVSFATIF